MHLPTSDAVTAFVVLALAIFGGVVTLLNYINAKVFPAITDLKTNIALLKQHTDTITARQNGQSAKIDTLLLAAPPPSGTVINNGPSGTVNEPPSVSTPETSQNAAPPAPAPNTAPSVSDGAAPTEAGGSPITAAEVQDVLGHD